LVTAADSATGMLADLECVSQKGEIVLAVEVKDGRLTIRDKKVSEIFFVAQQGIYPRDKASVADLLAREFVSGHNVYVMDLLRLSEVVLALLGEEGRREFLEAVGVQLDKYRSDIAHRRAWAELLANT